MKPTEFLNELSNEKLAKYKTAAAADATKADSEGDYKRGDKRFSGIVKATKKQFANDEKGITEMDSEGYKGSRDDYELGKGKEHTGKAITANNMVKAAKKVWDYATEPVDAPNIETYKKHRAKNIADIRKNKQEDVKEAYNNYHANRTGFSRPSRDLSGEGEPAGMFAVVIDGRPWKEFTSNKAFQVAKTIATKHPDKKVQVKWPTGQLNTVSEEKQRLDAKCWSGYKKQGTKMKGDTRVNNCVPVKESAILQGVKQLDEGWKEKLGAAALAGSMALGAGAAHSRVTPDGQGGFTGGLKPSATVTAPSDDKPAAEAPKGFSKEYLQKAANPDRIGRYMISVEKAQELLKSMP